MIEVRYVSMSWRRRVALSVLFWAGVVGLLWLDRHAGVAAQRLDVFSAIWAALSAVGAFLGDVGGAIATSLEGVVAYLVSAVGWLAGQVAKILVSTGTIFARVWDGLKVVWNDVLKPALVWVDQQLGRLQAWLKDTLRPVFDFLSRVRDELMGLYRRFVQPIIDTIEFIRALNRVLLAFHIHFLQALDTVLQQIEQRIEEPILWINAKLNEIWNVLELVMTLDGFFQRLTLVKSMSRYAPAWLRIAANARSRPLTGAEQGALARAGESQSVPELVADLQAYFDGAANDTGAVIDALAADFSADWQ